MSIQHTIGKKGEDIAVSYLSAQKYEILERNWRSGRAEIDIIAKENDTLVFIEVKSKSSTFYGPPELAVDERKELLVFSAANRYMEKMNYEWAIRFDIISILFEENGIPKINHFKDAFH